MNCDNNLLNCDNNVLPPDKGPIFVVGSPRSGTSILTWCLGQHPNILALEESNWLDSLSYCLRSCYAAGSGRGERSQLSALKVTSPAFFETFAGAVHDMVFAHRRSYEDARSQEAIDLGINLDGIEVSRNANDPKQRWVDGTPEYSLAIPGMRTLFKDARFVHLVRDVESVVKSMLNFHRLSANFTDHGQNWRLVGSEQEAYEYWLRTVTACLEAERAYGSNVVMRVRFQDLIASPEATLAKICEFLGETYSSYCLEPLQHRINSSTVPVDFQSFDPKTDPSIRESAARLSEQALVESPAITGSGELAALLERAFVSRSVYLRNSDRQLVACQAILAEAERELADYRESGLWERVRELLRSHTPYDACIAVMGSLDSQRNTYLDRMYVPLLPKEGITDWGLGIRTDAAAASANPYRLIPNPSDPAAMQEVIISARDRGCGFLLLLPDAVHWLGDRKKLRAFLDDAYRRFDGPLRQIVLYDLTRKNVTHNAPLPAGREPAPFALSPGGPGQAIVDKPPGGKPAVRKHSKSRSKSQESR